MYQYPAPGTEQEFERVCLLYLRKEWDRPRLKLYRKRGHKQYGVDIFDEVHPECWTAQCKHQEWNKAVTPATIRSEVAKAESFPHAIKHYAICAVSKSATAQDEVRKLNDERRALGKFTVELICWDDVSLLLDSDEDFRNAYLKVSLGSVRNAVRKESKKLHTGIKALRETVEATNTNSEIDQQLNLAKRLIDEGKYAAGEALLSDLRTTKLSQMTPSQRFRCFWNLGVLRVGDGEDEEAATLMLKAVDAYPEHEHAALHRSQALNLRGDADGAWEWAQRAFQQTPSRREAIIGYLSNAPLDADEEDLLAIVSRGALRADLAVVLANRCLRRFEHAKAAAWLDRVEAPDDDADAHQYLLARAWSIAGAYLSEDPRELYEDPEAQEHLREALGLFERAASLAEKDDAPRYAREARMAHCRVAAHMRDDALLDESLREGFRLAGENKAAKLDLQAMQSQLLISKGAFDRAIDAARSILRIEDDANARMLLAVALWNRNGRGDRETARTQLLSAFERLTGAMLEQAIEIIAVTSAEDGLFREARAAIDRAQEKGIEPALAATLKARIALVERNLETMREHALLAAQQLGELSSSSTRRLAATLLLQLGENEPAIEALRPLASKSAMTSDTARMMAAAIEVNHHKTVLEFGQSLWERGALQPAFEWAYLNVLQEYDPGRALDLVESRLTAASDQPGVSSGALRARRVLLQARLHRPVQTISTADLPAALDAPVAEAPAYVKALSASGHHREAAEYAYAVLLQNPDDPAAHAALIMCFLGAPENADLVHATVAVTEGCAVEYQEHNDPPKRCTIERKRVPGMPDVIGIEEPLAQRLLGSREGDLVDLAPGTSGRPAKILRVFPSIVLRFNDSIDSWQIRFPQIGFLEQLRLQTDPETGELDLSSIMKLLQERAAVIERIDNVYRGGVMPMALVAERSGKHLFDTMTHLAHDDDLFVNCTWGSHETMARARATLDAAKGLVLDGTALWTIHHLGLSSILANLPIPVVIVQASLDAVQEKALSPTLGREGGTLGLEGSRPVLRERDERAERQRLAVWADTEAVLRSLAVCGATSLAALPLKRREELVSFIGVWSAQNIAAAHEQGFVLWADDRPLEYLADAYFHVPRVWTQAILTWLLQRKHLDVTAHRRASARLKSWRFTGTFVDDGTVVEAAQLANWKAGDPVLTRNLDVSASRRRVATPC